MSLSYMFLLLFSTKCVTDVQNCSFDNRFHFKSIKLHAQNGILALLMSDGRNSVFINISPYFMFFKVTSCFYWVLCTYMVDVWTRGSERWILWFEMEPFALFRVMSRQRNISSVSKPGELLICLKWVNEFRKCP